MNIQLLKLRRGFVLLRVGGGYFAEAWKLLLAAWDFIWLSLTLNASSQLALLT